MKESYDRTAVGARLMERRKQFGWSRSFVSKKIGIVEKYYADIERGCCGMSIETLIALSKLYGFTMDGMIYGEENEDAMQGRGEVLLKNLKALPDSAQDRCLQMLFLFIDGISQGAKENEKR